MIKTSAKNECKSQMVKSFEGTLLKNKYLVERILGQGSFGSVHKLVDIKSQSNGLIQQQMVAKASTDVEMLYNEITALKQINSYVESQLQSIDPKTANAIPVNCSRGLVYLQKNSHLFSSKSTECSGDSYGDKNDGI